VRDIARVLGAHWKMIGIVTAAVVLAAFTTAKRTVPRYRSDASFQVGSKKYSATRLEEPNVNELDIKTDPVLSEALILKTQNLALEVVDSLGLQLRILDAKTPRGSVLENVRVARAAPNDTFLLYLKGPAGYEVRDKHGRVLDAGAYPAPVADSARGFSFLVLPSAVARVLRFAIESPAAAASEVRGGLSFDVQPGTTVVGASYEGADPSLTPDILNEALAVLREFGVARLREMATQREDFLRRSLAEAGGQYRQSLAALQRYKESQNATDLGAEEQSLLNSVQMFRREEQTDRETLSLLQSVLSSADTSITIEVLNRLAAIREIATNGAVDFQLRNLLKLYDDRRTLLAGTLGLKEDNPQVEALDQRIQQAGRALRQAAQATAVSLQADIAAHEARIRDLRGQLAGYPGKENQIGQLELDAALYNDTYRYLLTQLQAAQISSATITPYTDVVESATVSHPIGMRLRDKLVIGLLVGLFLGVLVAFFLEYLDQTIKTAADVERVLEIPVLGLIPLDPRGRRAGHRRHAIPLITHAAPDDPTSEAYRTLRTNVTFVSAEQRTLRLIAVTSPGPGEGKSTTAANLAITLAHQGVRTLLVDADLRRPLVHHAFNLVQAPGLTDVLVGTATLPEALRPNVIPNLDVLPGGALPPNPSELLGSEAMRRLLEQLRAQYDSVIFDTPPSLAVTDATVLGASTDAVILVLWAAQTEEAAAQRAVEMLRRVQARVAGSVLNGVGKQRDRYYQYYYGRKELSRGNPLATLRRRVAGK
jgi:tyrosine-protein kinase Etk/Wzc